MHLARKGHPTVLWGSEFDQRVLPDLLEQRHHPSLPEFLPESLTVLGPDRLEEAARDVEIAVMGAHAGGARTLVRIVMDGGRHLPLVIGVAKGLEPDTLTRMSEVYAEEVGHHRVISIGGPCLAPEVAQGLPCGVVFASAHRESAEAAPGVEYSMVAKNVAAIGLGILDGLGKGVGFEYRNAKAALFTQACAELREFVVALGGREETVSGLAGTGDVLVTMIGGRNRLFGELLGEGVSPADALEDLNKRGMTVEGVASSREVAALVEGKGLALQFMEQVNRIVFEGAPAASVLDCLEG